MTVGRKQSFTFDPGGSPLSAQRVSVMTQSDVLLTM
jgi:hypothetical protein